MLSLRKRAANDYLSKHKEHFVTLTKFDEYKIKGVLKEVTPDFMLLIENNYGSIWRIEGFSATKISLSLQTNSGRFSHFSMMNLSYGGFGILTTRCGILLMRLIFSML